MRPFGILTCLPALDKLSSFFERRERFLLQAFASKTPVELTYSQETLILKQRACLEIVTLVHKSIAWRLRSSCSRRKAESDNHRCKCRRAGEIGVARGHGLAVARFDDFWHFVVATQVGGQNGGDVRVVVANQLAVFHAARDVGVAAEDFQKAVVLRHEGRVGAVVFGLVAENPHRAAVADDLLHPLYSMLTCRA